MHVAARGVDAPLRPSIASMKQSEVGRAALVGDGGSVMLHARAYLRVWMVLALVLGMLAMPGAPAVAAGEAAYWTLRSDAVNVVRDGVAYKMRISAEEQVAESEQFLQVFVELWRTKDPAGPAMGTQTLRYVFWINGDSFTHSSDLARARLLTGARLGSFGTLDVTFEATGDRRDSCGDQIKTRAGTLSGTVVFDTQTELFSRINKVGREATVSVDRRNFDDFQFDRCPGDTTTCIRPQEVIEGEKRGATFSARELDDASYATVEVNAPARTLKKDGATIGMLTRTVQARLPDENFSLGSDMARGRVEAADGTFLSGIARYERGTSGFDAVLCEGRRNQRTITGSLTSVLQPNFLTGSDEFFAATSTASATAYWQSDPQ